MAHWTCVKNCGACCYLDPTERPDLADYLTPSALEHYLSLVGPEGWCVHFDPDQRQCRIYAERPRFCRVQPDIFQDLYGIEPVEFDEFAIACCQEQISDVHGSDSPELHRYLAAVGLPAIVDPDPD
ncbi:MAG: YkgJ family cysteine cluster protein [Spirulinaceae cyanobacterium RM2_2_10]|nr:YkgJ family cysteine cluster protein [Spirulinaceae cyanobacterium RM2_2_10]